MSSRLLDPRTNRYYDSKKTESSVPAKKNILAKTVDLMRQSPYIVAFIIIAFILGYSIASKKEYKKCNNYIKSRSTMSQLRTRGGVPQMPQPQFAPPQMTQPQFALPQMPQPPMAQQPFAPPKPQFAQIPTS